MRIKSICLSVVLFTLVSQLVCFSAFAALDVQRWSDLGKTGHEFLFSIPSSCQIDAEDFTRFLSDSSSKYSVSIIKSTSSLENNKQSLVVSGAFAWDTFPIDQLKLTGGDLPRGSYDFLASWNTGNKNQSGTVSSVGNIYPVSVQPIEKYTSDGGVISGQYLVTSIKAIDKNALLSDISTATGLDENALLSCGYGSDHSARPLVVASCGLLFIAISSYVLSVIAFPLVNAHSYGVLKLLGWKNSSSWWEMMKYPIFLSVGLSVAAIIAQVLLITGARCEYYCAAIAVAFLVIALMLVLSTVSLAIISKISSVSLTSKKMSFKPVIVFGLAMKICTAFVIAALIQMTAPMFNQCFDMLASKAKWAPYENLSVLSGAKLTQADMNLLSSNPSELGRKYASLYADINARYGGQFIQDSSSYDVARLTVNVNYLSNNCLLDEHREQISISENEGDRVILIPVSQRQHTDDIVSEEQSYLSKLYNGNLNRFGDKEVSSSLKYIYYQDRSFFLFDRSSSKDTLSAPIIQVITEGNVTTSEKSYLQMMGLSFPMKMDLTTAKAQELQSFLDASDTFGGNRIRVTTIGTALSEELLAQGSSFLTMMLYIFLLLLVGVAAGIIVTVTIFTVDRQKVCVKKLLGWKTLDRYGITPRIVALCDAIAIATVAISTKGAVAPAVAFLSLGLDFMFYMLVLVLFEKRNLPLMLKGE